MSGDPDDLRFIASCTVYISYPNVADLYNRNYFFRKVISLLEQNKYDEYRFICVHEHRHGQMYFSGHANDYSPLIEKSIWPENPTNKSEITRKLKLHGDVIVLGDPSDPTLIPVRALSCIDLRRYVNDEEKKRRYTLIFLMIVKDSHMTTCFPLSEETWLLYDNDPQKPPVQPSDLKYIKNYDIRFGGDVNVTQAEEYELGTAETGEGAELSNECEELQLYSPEWSRLLELEKLIAEEMNSYMKADASHCSFTIKRSCVIDSHLAAFHITAILFPNIAALFNSDELLKKCLSLLHNKMYAEAKVACLGHLKHVQIDQQLKLIDFYGSTYDHITLIQKFICAEITDHGVNENDPIHEQVLREFNTFSQVMALGDPANPSLVLGYDMNDKPPLRVEDQKKRTFELQFLLLGEGDHMTMCFRYLQNEWILYDNDRAKPSFQNWTFNKFKSSDTILAGYVNVSQAQEYKGLNANGSRCSSNGSNFQSTQLCFGSSRNQ